MVDVVQEHFGDRASFPSLAVGDREDGLLVCDTQDCIEPNPERSESVAPLKPKAGISSRGHLPGQLQKLQRHLGVRDWPGVVYEKAGCD